MFTSFHLAAASDMMQTASQITSTGLAQQQELPSFTGESAAPALVQVPETPTVNQAVQRAIQWHPSISEAVGKLLEQASQVDVAQAKYYPQVSAGMDNGYSNAYSE